MCGEHWVPIYVGQTDSGSSPHVRGTLNADVAQVKNSRFIPACAGNTWRKNCTPSQMTVHPRMCGEHINDLGKAIADAGSSPHVRGTLVDLSMKINDQRFIPACAGNTC